MKSALLLMLTGAMLGAIAASFAVPPMLSWYSAPGGLPQGAAIPALVNIPDVIRYATTRLLIGQSVGGALGAVAGLLISVAFKGQRHSTSVNPSLPVP
jgi:hypothetical protein